MEEKAEPEPSNGDDGFSERERSAMLANDRQKGTFLQFYSLPEDLRRIMAGYISDNKIDPKKFAVLGEQRITLCLSQLSQVEPGPCWRFGCLSHEEEWETSRGVLVDKQYLIKDSESCLHFLRRENSPYYAMVVEVLVFQLDLSSQAFSSALDDLEHTLRVLQEHLNRVQYVVLAIEKHAFFCFSFKDIIDHVTKVREAVNLPQALKQILVDLRTYWATNETLGTKLLLDRYIVQDVKPVSEMYLSNFVISISHRRHRDLFDAVDPTLESGKLKWIYYVETLDEAENIDQRITRRCHAFHFDTSKIKGWYESMANIPPALVFEDNQFIERIVLDANLSGCALILPRPSAPLPDPALPSALIELTLKGNSYNVDLTQLNNGHFPYLEHLSVLGGFISSHLDSHRVPCLKTLRMELGFSWRRLQSLVEDSLNSPIREHTQSLIGTRRPWQLVAAQEPDSWSFASYDDGKKIYIHSPHLQPLIRELMLVVGFARNVDEWQVKLNGKPSREAFEGDHNGGLLVWALDRVEKITTFCTAGRSEVLLDFTQAIPGQTRLLTSLACQGINVAINGAALPHLKSLELKQAQVTLLGAFPSLQTLLFQHAVMALPWLVDAPKLQSFSYFGVENNKKLSLRPELLPHLSYLRIKMWEGNITYSPTILVDESSLGLSQVKYVVFGPGMTQAPFFNQFQVQNVLHLELHLDLASDGLKLPAHWDNTVWQCETLTINVYAQHPRCLRETGITLIKLPRLLPRVRKLTVTYTCSQITFVSGMPHILECTVSERDCPVLLDSEMPELTDCTVKSPRMLGANFRCPALQRICFTGNLSDAEKMMCLDRATYVAIGAQPRWIRFNDDGEVNSMSWDAAPNASGELSLAGPLKESDDSSVSRD